MPAGVVGVSSLSTGMADGSKRARILSFVGSMNTPLHGLPYMVVPMTF